MTDARVHVEAASGPRFLDAMHGGLARLRSMVNCDSESWNAFITAVAEVGVDIVEHANARHVVLDLSGSDHELVSEFVDDGDEFVPPPRLKLPPDTHERGRGLYIAAAALDSLDYSRRDGRNHWRLAKRMAPGGANPA